MKGHPLKLYQYVKLMVAPSIDGYVVGEVNFGNVLNTLKNALLKKLCLATLLNKLLMSQVVQQEALTRLLVEKGIFTQEEFLEMVKVVNQEMKIKKG